MFVVRTKVWLRTPVACEHGRRHDELAYQTGGFGYHPKDPGGYARIDQSLTKEGGITTSNHVDKPSDFSAGMSALLVGADLLNFRSAAPPQENRDKTIPSELKEIKTKSKKGSAGQFAGGKVDKGRLQGAIKDGMGWYSKHTSIKTTRWQYYFLYGLERFQSYREMITGRTEKEPHWYNGGVAFLSHNQDPKEGHWGKGKPGGPAINTAFAVLFLMRSTKKTLGLAAFFDDHGLVAKLPNTLGKVSDDGTINKGTPDQDTQSVIEELINNPSFGVFDATVVGSDLLSKSEKKRREQVKRLQQLVRAGSYTKRRAAVRILATSGKLDDQTFSLIVFALTDPDYRVVNVARDSLRFMSRKLDGFGLENLKNNSELKANAAQVKRTVNSWKKWYRSLRPTAKFTVFNE